MTALSWFGCISLSLVIASVVAIIDIRGEARRQMQRWLQRRSQNIISSDRFPA
jgi:hypothetical protein